MNNIIVFAPCAVFVITLLIQIGVFARSSELLSLKAEMLEYVAKNYLSKDIYADNHKSLQEDLTQMRQDIADVKNLLITIVTKNSSNN
ncbi:MAG: hypothetical protein LUH05_04200 [Candidatus Gastranaerophilales bacterium]|nr:hypothetical protein [Candidatus Gastranaerophilales bacterium]